MELKQPNNGKKHTTPLSIWETCGVLLTSAQGWHCIQSRWCGRDAGWGTPAKQHAAPSVYNDHDDWKTRKEMHGGKKTTHKQTKKKKPFPWGLGLLWHPRYTWWEAWKKNKNKNKKKHYKINVKHWDRFLFSYSYMTPEQTCWITAFKAESLRSSSGISPFLWSSQTSSPTKYASAWKYSRTWGRKCGKWYSNKRRHLNSSLIYLCTRICAYIHMYVRTHVLIKYHIISSEIKPRHTANRAAVGRTVGEQVRQRSRTTRRSSGHPDINTER